jgi:hypothetical protein
MTALAVLNPYPEFFELDGDPLDDGFVYFGTPGANPITSPIQAYWDAAATIPMPQPARTLNGYIARSGTPALVYIDGSYSLLVQDKRGRTVFYAPTSADFGNAAALQTLITQFIAGLADTADVSNGDALIGVRKTLAGSTATTQHEVNERRMSPFDFMTATQIANAKARTAQDLSSVLATMVSVANVISAAGGSPCFEWPDAQFSYATSPNWGIKRLSMIGIGMAEFKHTGAGVAFVCDTSAVGGPFGGQSIKLDNLLITGNASTTYGVSLVRLAACSFSNLRVRGAVTRGFNIQLAVYCKFDTCMVSINADPTFTAASRGFYVGSSGGLATTDCTFVNCIAEGNLIGWDLAECDFNVWIGGTGEACTAYGVAVNPLSKGNQLIGMTGEANTTADIIDQGRGTGGQGGYFTNLLSFAGAVRPIFRDAQCQSVLIDVTTSGGSFRDIRFSSFGVGGTFVNNSTDTFPKNIFNGNTSVLAFGDAIGRNPVRSLAAITVAASPFTYTNSTAFVEQIIVRNAVGTVTQVDLRIAGFLGSPTTVGGAAGLAAPGIHMLHPGDQLTVSYSGAVASIDMVRRPL